MVIDMPVAKSYLDSKILDGPVYGRGGKQYVTIELGNGTVKTVRWYTNDEWKRMYPELASTVENNQVDYRKVFGFGDAGYITIYYGDTYNNLEWFKREPSCRYNKFFGWYTISTEQVPENIPDGIETAKLFWNDVNDGLELDKDRARQAVEALTVKPSNSQFVGEVGQRIETSLTVERKVEVVGMYGTSIMHIMHDNSGNVFIWTTASKELEAGVEYHMRGTVKDHRTYKGVQQTILTRCSIVKK